MITAVEQGRNLKVTVGDGDDAIVAIIPPVPSKVGAAALALWAGIMFGQTEDPATDAVNMARMTLGEEAYELASDVLRSAEAEAMIHAAFLWNVQGGGIEFVNEFLSDGYPKARESLLKAVALWEEFSRLATLLNGVLENPTQSLDDILATTTPTGTSEPSASTVDRLPPTRRSIRQNEA